MRRAQDRVVERIREAGLERGVDGGELEHLRRGCAGGVVGALELDHALGERAGLVGAQHVHAAEVLDGVEPAHEHAVARHHLRAARQVDAEDGRQQLRAEADRERDGEQQRLDRRATAQHVHGEDEQHHHEHRARQQVAEAADAAVELRLRRPQRRGARRSRRTPCAARRDDEAARACRCARCVPRNTQFVRSRRLRAARRRARAPSRPGKLSPVSTASLTKKSVASRMTPSAGHQAAGREQHDVARHDLLDARP